MTAGAPVIRDDLDRRADNHIFDWETGDAARTERVFRDAEVHGHPGHALSAPGAPGAARDLRHRGGLRPGDGQVDGLGHQPGPRMYRTLAPKLVTGVPEHKIRVVSPDIGGGFGNKVPIYPAALPVRDRRLDAHR